jgi:hypothetical protein
MSQRCSRYFEYVGRHKSRQIPSIGDWMLSSVALKSSKSIWKVKVDLFASEWNLQLPLFVSWFPQPQALRVDAFSFSWKNQDGFCFPPFNLIHFVLSKLLKKKADLVLVTPFWPSQPCFRRLWNSLATLLGYFNPTQPC